MSHPEQRRRVTRTFVLTLAAFVTIFALALLVGSWGLLSLALDSKPIESDIPFQATPLVIAVAVFELFWLLWRFALSILRGSVRGPWLFAVLAGALAYLTFGLLELIVGLNPREAFFTVYPLTLALSWFVAVPVFYALLSRQVFTDRPAPAWPWERRERQEREREQELFRRLEQDDENPPS